MPDKSDVEFWETLDARLVAANILGKKRDWTFESHPGPATQTHLVRKWVNAPKTAPRGLLLFGNSGTGKSGLGIAALRDMIEKGVGSEYYWMLTSGRKTIGDVEAGHMRRRPAPVMYDSWASFIRRLQHAMAGRDDDAETEYELIREYSDRCTCLMLDDIDVGQLTPFREALLLVFLAWTEESDRRLILTMNREPEDAAPFLGERVIDRITGSDFLKVKMSGASLRGR